MLFGFDCDDGRVCHVGRVLRPKLGKEGVENDRDALQLKLLAGLLGGVTVVEAQYVHRPITERLPEHLCMAKLVLVPWLNGHFRSLVIVDAHHQLTGTRC